MRTIHKYVLPTIKAALVPVEAMMPRGARIIHAEDNNASDWTVWAEVDDAMPLTARRFAVFGTGAPMPGRAGSEDLIHLLTVLRGPFVWHLYEVADG